MPANRCSMCGVSWPEEKKECPLCGDSTSYFSDVEPTKDWEELIEERQRSVQAKGSATAKYTNARFERFRRGGLDIDKAMILAGDKHAELHTFEDLIENGCTPDIAYEIVR